MDPLCYLCKTSPLSQCRSCDSLKEARREALEQVESWLQTRGGACDGVMSFLSQQIDRLGGAYRVAS